MVAQAPSGPWSSAGLTAHLVYRRPAARRELLGFVADLGMFVVESAFEPGSAGRAGDVTVLIASASDLKVLNELAEGSAAPVLVCVPDGADTRPFLEAGAHRCVTDREFAASAPSLLAETAAAARAARDARALRPGIAIADVSFDPGIPSIAKNGHARVLSRSESAVLRRLHEAGGYPVEASELERFATPPGLLMRPGFLKATILRLRRKLREIGADGDTIRTVRGFGYALCIDGSEA
jgi:DNA-binding response OmpR family regulator